MTTIINHINYIGTMIYQGFWYAFGGIVGATMGIEILKQFDFVLVLYLELLTQLI